MISDPGPAFEASKNCGGRSRIPRGKMRVSLGSPKVKLLCDGRYRNAPDHILDLTRWISDAGFIPDIHSHELPEQYFAARSAPSTSPTPCRSSSTLPPGGCLDASA